MAGEEETKIQGKASGGSSWGISGGWSAGMAGSGWWDETTGRIVARLRGNHPLRIRCVFGRYAVCLHCDEIVK